VLRLAREVLIPDMFPCWPVHGYTTARAIQRMTVRKTAPEAAPSVLGCTTLEKPALIAASWNPGPASRRWKAERRSDETGTSAEAKTHTPASALRLPAVVRRPITISDQPSSLRTGIDFVQVWPSALPRITVP
jgi:hypothetical protein